MSQNRRYFEDWELEQLNKLVEYKKEKFAIEDGRKEGLKQGIAQGIEQGIQKGIQKGIDEGREQAIEAVIRNMLEGNFDIATIAKVTNKTEEEIMKIKESL